MQNFIDWMREIKGVSIDAINMGAVPIYFSYLPGGKHQQRLGKKIEDIYAELKPDAPIPLERKWMRLDIAGTVIESGTDFTMPPVQYFFR